MAKEESNAIRITRKVIEAERLTRQVTEAERLQEITAEEAERRRQAIRVDVAREFVRDMIRTYPLTAAGMVERNRSFQKYKLKLVCKAFASKRPESILRYPYIPRLDLDPKLIHSNLDPFIEWALREPGGARKNNQVRDETIALMVSTILLNTELRPTRNRASRAARGSACSIVAEMLSESGIHVSEDLVENAWKRHAKKLKLEIDFYRPDRIPSPKSRAKTIPSEK